MITIEDLKKIEKSPYYENFVNGISQLTGNLFTFTEDPNMFKIKGSAISEDDMETLKYFRSDLRTLIYGQTDRDKETALKRLENFPGFLQKKAFADQVNSPTILERMDEVESYGRIYRRGELKKNLVFAVKALELDLTPELSVQTQGSDREIWSKTAAPTIPGREEAEAGTWAALFHSLTKESAKPNPCQDVSVYEHKCSDNTLRRMAALRHLMKNEGSKLVPGKQALNSELEKLRKDPLTVMTLRNEYTVEQLRRGNISDVVQRIGKTGEQFSFQNERELRDAKARAKRIHAKMEAMEGKAASSPEFTALKNALKEFSQVEWTKINKTVASANVLLAVENFTKGRKNVQRSARAQECVNLALDALVSAVPNAASNPHVTPLIDRFNEVRSAGRQIELTDFGAARTYSAEQAKKDVAQYNMQELPKAAEAMSRLHGGRIDPVSFSRIRELLVDSGQRYPVLTDALRNGDERAQNAATALLEEMTKDPQLRTNLAEIDQENVKQAIEVTAKRQDKSGLNGPERQSQASLS